VLIPTLQHKNKDPSRKTTLQAAANYYFFIGPGRNPIGNSNTKESYLLETMTTSTTSFEVQLAVYDLSHGMARQLSAQFLGGPQYAIDIIPHTGIVVYGQEYFFGGGIQHQNPHVFRQSMGIYPVQTLSLGRTTKTRAEFEQWCQNCTVSGRYTMASYDLLTRNCNNFCHDAAVEGLGLSQVSLVIAEEYFGFPVYLVL